MYLARGVGVDFDYFPRTTPPGAQPHLNRWSKVRVVQTTAFGTVGRRTVLGIIRDA